MSLTEYALFAFTSLVVIVDPIAIVPAFVAMTANDTKASRKRAALVACLVACGVLISFALTGRWIFRILGITMPAFQIAGSILLLRIALDMLYAQRTRDRESDEEVEAGTAKDDIAITPLAIPMIAGPGAISSVLILLNQATTPAHVGILYACIVGVVGLCYITLRFAVTGMQWLNPLALNLVTRIMGLLLAAVAVQFVVNAVAALPFVGGGGAG